MTQEQLEAQLAGYIRMNDYLCLRLREYEKGVKRHFHSQLYWDPFKEIYSPMKITKKRKLTIYPWFGNSNKGNKKTGLTAYEQRLVRRKPKS